jgi:hypothetical protein
MKIENIEKANELVKKRKSLLKSLQGINEINANTITINPGYFDQTIIDGPFIAGDEDLFFGERLKNLVAEFKDNVATIIKEAIDATDDEIKEL